MKDRRVQVQQQQQQQRQVRARLRRGMLRTRQPKKKSSKSKAVGETSVQLLPVLLPHLLFKNMVQSGLISELMLGGIVHRSLVGDVMMC